MYLLRELTGLSLIKIGEHFDRDHTTVLHGIKKIEGLMPARGSTHRQVQDLTKRIRARSRGSACAGGNHHHESGDTLCRRRIAIDPHSSQPGDLHTAHDVIPDPYHR